jgi:hypothetical protein
MHNTGGVVVIDFLTRSVLTFGRSIHEDSLEAMGRKLSVDTFIINRHRLLVSFRLACQGIRNAYSDIFQSLICYRSKPHPQFHLRSHSRDVSFHYTRTHTFFKFHNRLIDEVTLALSHLYYIFRIKLLLCTFDHRL